MLPWLALPAAGYGPETLYTLHCQGCHLADGSGLPGRVPALGSQLGRLAGSPAGRAYLVRVPGVANAPIGDADLAALLTSTLRRFAPGALAPDLAPFTADEVHRLRARSGDGVK